MNDKDDKQDPTISERIENAVEGLLRFGARMLRTSWLIMRHPLHCSTLLLRADRTEKLYVLPLTYLTIGGFIFTLVIAVYPFGLLNVLDVIWFDEDISRNIYQNFASAFSITGLLTAAFPVFISVVLLSNLAQPLLSEAETRTDFFTISYYLFGYQTLFFFVVIFSLLFLDVLVSTINGPYIIEIIDEPMKDVMITLSFLILAIIWVSAVVAPALGLSSWCWSNWRSRRTTANFLRMVLMPAYALLMLMVISYAASLPSVLKEKVADAPLMVTLDFVGDVNISLSAAQESGYVASLSVDLVIDNAPDSILIAEARNFSLFVELEREHAENDRWFSRNHEIKENGQSVGFIHIDRQRSRVFHITGNIDLSDENVALMRDKAEGKPASNSYGFFVGVELSRGSDQFERIVAVDEADALAEL